MKARHALVGALLKIKTYAAVEAAYGHTMDMLRLCRGDNMGVRDLVPALALRLGRDQQCYDFCKWWATTGKEGNYDWNNLGLPYLDVKGADVFDSPPKDVDSKDSNFSHNAAIILLKIRLLLDVRALQTSSVIGHKVPQEILDGVHRQLVSCSVVAEKSQHNERHKPDATYPDSRDAGSGSVHSDQEYEQALLARVTESGKALEGTTGGILLWEIGTTAACASM